MINIKNPLFISLYLLAAFLAFNSNFAFADTKIDETKSCFTNLCKPKKEKKCKDRNCCDSCQSITRKDFKQNGKLSKTFVIDKPGKYCLCESIDFEPVDSFTPAIQILSDDVILNLCGNTLRQTNTTDNAYGIQIGQGYHFSDPNAVFKNITIENGTIENFSAIGIFCYNASFDHVTRAAKLPFESLAFIGLNILECGSSPSFDHGSGLDLDSAAPFPFQIVSSTDPVAFDDVIIKNCNVNRCVGNAAIRIRTFDNAIITDTQANDLIQTLVVFSTFGYSLIGRNLQMMRCQGNGTSDFDQASGSTVGGIAISRCLNAYVADSQFNDAFGSGDFIVANQMSLTENVLCQNCQFNNNRGGDFTLTVQGVHCSGSGAQVNSKGLKFVNCQFNGSRISPNNPGGEFGSWLAGLFYLDMTNLVMEDCQALDIVTTNTNYQAFGFNIATFPWLDKAPAGVNTNITLTRCIASDIAGGGTSVGFFLPSINIPGGGVQGIQINLVLDNCIAERISSTVSTSRDVVAGIAESLYAAPTNNLFDIPTFFHRMRNLLVNNCRVSDVHSNVGGTSIARSAGILVESVEDPVIIGNSVTDCDRGILLTGTNEIIPNGFQLAMDFANATAFPPVFIPLTSIPAPAPMQTFTNLTHPSVVTISPSASTIDLQHSFILPAVEDLTALGWQSGDMVVYDHGISGTDIGGLVSTTTYFAIVYIPGFSSNGVIQDNEVDNCSISGYQDDAPTTSSLWVNNTAFDNGTPNSAAANYAIAWGLPPLLVPVDAGSLSTMYPNPGNKYYNLSMIP